MVYDASIRRSIGTQNAWTDQQVEELARLEQVKTPTDWQRGALSALRLSTPRQHERDRAEALKSKWSEAPARRNDTDLDAGGLL